MHQYSADADHADRSYDENVLPDLVSVVGRNEVGWKRRIF